MLLQRLLTLLAKYFAHGKPGAPSAAGGGEAGEDGEAGEAGEGGGGSPSLAQVVGWLNVLLDAHFAKLVMRRRAL